ncbi:unnamed protein product [Microthlaspi erraticum]|uniref:Uncharacterized protein n=1 Tax=Microthlaspi erraticum TaxID=1685480 RepID=A0A6D2JXB0_9BRAS|nr:unnamed protein product [Microthlaspi erraticum]
MGHKEHGGTWHMEAAQLDTQRKKGEAILKTSSTVHSTNRSSSSTRPAKLQLDRAGSQSQTRKMSIWSTMEHLGREEQGRTLCLELSLTAHARSEEEAALKPARPTRATNWSS